MQLTPESSSFAKRIPYLQKFSLIPQRFRKIGKTCNELSAEPGTGVSVPLVQMYNEFPQTKGYEQINVAPSNLEGKGYCADREGKAVNAV